MAIYTALLTLAEKINGVPITSQFARDMVGLCGAIFGFGLIVLVCLTPYGILRGMFGRK